MFPRFTSAFSRSEIGSTRPAFIRATSAATLLPHVGVSARKTEVRMWGRLFGFKCRILCSHMHKHAQAHTETHKCNRNTLKHTQTNIHQQTHKRTHHTPLPPFPLPPPPPCLPTPYSASSAPAPTSLPSPPFSSQNNAFSSISGRLSTSLTPASSGTNRRMNRPQSALSLTLRSRSPSPPAQTTARCA
jgi:hypothetical protein